MVNPRAFQGACKEFLLSQKPAYAAAVVRGDVGECLADIQHCYFKQFLFDSDHTVDPTPEWLASVDDDVLDPKPEPPNKEDMSPEEFEASQQDFMVRRKAIVARKEVSW